MRQPTGIRRTVVAALVFGIILLSACSPHRIDESYAPRQERQALIDAFESLNIDRADYVRRWTEASIIAVDFPERVELPYSMVHILDPYWPEARAVDFTVQEPGRYVLSVESTSTAYFFMDLYRRRRDDFSFAASRSFEESKIVLDVRRSGEYRLLLQPEPLRGGELRLTIERHEAG